ncbi:MAG: hypothetical protein WA958_22080 [Tunicatimonas sp.]
MTLQIEIIDPKAKRLLEDLADLGVISIKKNSSKERFATLLDQFRNQKGATPDLEDITTEVEEVRAERYRLKSEKD